MLDWSENYRICQTCSRQLNIVYDFRQLCFQSHDIRKKAVALIASKEIKVADLPNDDPDEHEYSDFKCTNNYDTSSEVDDVILEPESQHEFDPHNTRLKIEKEHADLGSSRTVSKNSKDPILKLDLCNTQISIETNSNLPKMNFVCIVCTSKFAKRAALVNHSVEQHGMHKMNVRPYACTECPKRFNTSSHWKAHYLNCHKNFRRDVCTYCGKKFSSRTALNTHEEVHQNKREYQCSMCPKRFNTSANRKGHELIVHTDPSKWKYICSICNKRFHSKSNMRTHIRRHNKEKPFSCHLCDKRFCDACDLQLHLPSHTNVREHKCTECEKEYKRERDLKMHMAKDHKVNNGVKPYVKKKKFCCHLCPKAFDAKDKLMRHLCSHTGDKPFPCTICDKRFTDKWYATQHMKTVHEYVTEKDQ